MYLLKLARVGLISLAFYSPLPPLAKHRFTPDKQAHLLCKKHHELIDKNGSYHKSQSSNAY